MLSLFLPETHAMCGRFTLRLPPKELQSFFDLIREVETRPRYNIAPTQNILAIRHCDGGRESTPHHWGLIPHWAKDRKLAARMISARGETVHEKPSFRAPFKKQRCLIPADGFYEWKKLADNTKQPYWIGFENDQPFAMAGLWSSWTDPESHQSILSCTIITTSANDLISELHERMPVILPKELWDVWLDPEIQDTDSLRPLLESHPSDRMRVRPVSRLVNSPRNDSPDCLQLDSSQAT